MTYIDRMVPNANNCDCGVATPEEQVEDKKQEVAVVLHSEAVVHPRTMVIHHENTSITGLAMMRSSWLDFIAGLAKSFPRFSRLVDRLVSVFKDLLYFF